MFQIELAGAFLLQCIIAAIVVSPLIGLSMYLGLLATVTPIAILVTLVALYFQKERLHEQER